jgi:hypothetical protein
MLKHIFIKFIANKKEKENFQVFNMEIFLMWLQLSVGFYKEDVYVFGCSN